MREFSDLRSKKNSISLEIESEMAGEIEAPSQPPSWGDKELRPTLGLVLAQVIDGSLKSHGVQRDPISNSSEICQRGTVCPATCGAVADHVQVSFSSALSTNGEHHHRKSHKHQRSLQTLKRVTNHD